MSASRALAADHARLALAPLRSAGFTTGTGDGLLVVKRFVEAQPQDNPLARYLPLLRQILLARIQADFGGPPALGADAGAPPVSADSAEVGAEEEGVGALGAG